MILEFTRMLRDVFADPATGVSALIPSLPLDGTDAAPPPVRVCDWTNEDWAVRDTIPSKQLSADEALIVIRPAAEEVPLAIPGNPELSSQHGSVSIVALYAARIDAAHEKTVLEAGRDAAYTIRVMQRCVQAWIERTTSLDRVRTHCVLAQLTGCSLYLFDAQPGSGYVGIGLALEGRMTDRWAEGIIPLTP